MVTAEIVTAEDVRELMNSRKSEPILIHYLDAEGGVEDDASIAAAAKFVFLQSDRITVANEIVSNHPSPRDAGAK